MNEAARAAMSPLYDQPVLVVDPGMHTAQIRSLAVDAAGSLAVTGSWDKTVRLWSLADGELIRTIRIPAGPGDIGKVYAVAMSPDGELVAAAGWTKDAREELIYLFEAKSGKTAQVISGLPSNVVSLAFSSDCRYLAAGLHETGLRAFSRGELWAEVFRDTDYGDAAYGVAFAADGRLASTSRDRMIRLYDKDFRLVTSPKKGASGNEPFGIAFSPCGVKLAVGYNDIAAVDLFDGQSLVPLQGPVLDGLADRGLEKVAWSADGGTLFAGGWHRGRARPVLAWGGAGRGQRRALQAGNVNTIIGVAPLTDGSLLVAAADPFLAVLDANGGIRWVRSSPNADFENQHDLLGVSAEGAIVDFGFEARGKSPLRFDLRARKKLSHDPPADDLTIRPKQDGLNGRTIALEAHERLRSSAVHPDGRCFVVGTDWFLRAYDAKAKLLWRREAPSVVYSANIANDGRLVIAACGDGTIRWHRMDDGRELLALYVLADKQNWVSWTPEGFYGATPGAFGVLRWHVNCGFDAAVETVPISDIPKLQRRDALPFVLQELETVRALGIADLIAARRDVQIRTGAVKAPGARLHVLAIGVSEYGENAAGLALKFADKDAKDVASALLNTQGGGLYAEVMSQCLGNDTATRAGIFGAFETMQRNMRSGGGQDMAVVLFSGHGAVKDGKFYLLPHGVDNSTKAFLKSSAISASDFQGEILNLSGHGRVLVLLDACRSAGLIDGAPGASLLSSAIAAGNVSVLTSSKADKLSREDEAWQHGAFTKVLLDALSDDDADTDLNGVISMTDLTAYIDRHLARLTDGDQQLGIELRFQGEIFVIGL